MERRWWHWKILKNLKFSIYQDFDILIYHEDEIRFSNGFFIGSLRIGSSFMSNWKKSQKQKMWFWGSFWKYHNHDIKKVQHFQIRKRSIEDTFSYQMVKTLTKSVNRLLRYIMKRGVHKLLTMSVPMTQWSQIWYTSFAIWLVACITGYELTDLPSIQSKKICENMHLYSNYHVNARGATITPTAWGYCSPWQ